MTLKVGDYVELVYPGYEATPFRGVIRMIDNGHAHVVIDPWNSDMAKWWDPMFQSAGGSSEIGNWKVLPGPPEAKIDPDAAEYYDAITA